MAELDYRTRRQQEERARRKRSVLLASALTVIFIVLLGVFGFSAVEDREGNGANEAVRSVPADVEMRTVVDSEGRDVQVPALPGHIACLDSFSGEMAIMCGAAERICGVPAGVRSDVLLQQKTPDDADWLSLSGNAVNIESLMDAGCDVALVRSTLSAAERTKLSNAGIPYVVVGYDDVPSQIEAMRLVGTACGGDAAASAENIAAFAEATVADVEQRVSGLSNTEHKKVYHAINDVLTCDGKDSLGADWIARSGCVDVSGGQIGGNQGDYQATLEQIYAWRPDAIICNSVSAARAFQSEARWAALTPVTEDAVLVIPTGATRWGQRGSVETYLAMLWLGKQIYPQIFADVDFEKTVRDYYRTYLGLEITDQQWQQIIAGEGMRSEGSGTGGGGGDGK